MVPADHLPAVYYINEHFCFFQNIQKNGWKYAMNVIIHKYANHIAVDFCYR